MHLTIKLRTHWSYMSSLEVLRERSSPDRYAVVSGSVQRGQGGTLKPERNAFLGSLHRIPALRMRAAVLTLDSIVLP